MIQKKPASRARPTVKPIASLFFAAFCLLPSALLLKADR
jgi:hypothetical protein